MARTELQHKLRGAVVRTIVYCVGMLAVMCVFTMAGSTWIPALAAMALLSGGGSYRISALRGHLALLDRRHVPLPAAKIHRA